MNILAFIFYLGIINIIFGFIWKWVFVLPMAFLFTVLNFDYGMRIVKLFGSYLLVSLTALRTLVALGDNPSGLAMIFYPLVGAFVLFMGYASNLYEAQKEARASFDWQMMQRLEKDSGFETLLMFGAVLFYILVLFIPAIATNGLTEWLFSVVDWIINLPIIGWLIGIGGVLFLLSTGFHGIFAFGMVTAMIVGKLRGHKETDLPESKHVETPASTKIQDEDTEDAYDKYVDKDDLTGSLSKIDGLLESQAGNRTELLDAKAETLNQMGKLSEAVKIYEQILSEDESYTNAYVALATIYQSKEIEEGKKYSQKIIDLYKTLEKIDSRRVSYYVLAGALKDKGDFIEALNYYEKAIEQEEKDNYFLENIYTDIAKIFVEQKKFTDALEAYDKAIKCSVAEYGDDSHCSEIYALKREIYERIEDWQKVKEMDKKFAAAEKGYNDSKEFSNREYHDERLGKIHESLEKLGEKERQTSDDLGRLVLLTIEDKYPSEKISYKKLGEIIEDVLEDVGYEKETRAIEKTRLISRLSEQIQNDKR